MSSCELLQRGPPPAATTTVQPSLARAIAAAAPMPLPPPVTTATFRHALLPLCAMMYPCRLPFWERVRRTGPGKALAAAGHEVVIGTRDPEQTKRGRVGRIDLPLAAYQDLDAEVFINATSGAGSLPHSAVGDALNGKVVIDTSNALDFSHGFPPSLFISNTDSLAEQLQRELPRPGS